MKKTLSLEYIPHVDSESNAKYYLSGLITLTHDSTEVLVTEVVDVDDISFPLSKLPRLLIEKFEQTLLNECAAVMSSPTFDWEDAPEL